MRVEFNDRLVALAIGKKERAARWLAGRLPRRVAYWATIRVAAHATTGEHSHQIVPELTVTDMLQRWDKP